MDDDQQEPPPGVNPDVPYVTTTAHHDRPCAACGLDTLTVVILRIDVGQGPRVAGGWAHCPECDAMPHPTMEVPGD